MHRRIVRFGYPDIGSLLNCNREHAALIDRLQGQRDFEAKVKAEFSKMIETYTGRLGPE